MSRINYLPRIGMYLKAFKHIISQDKEFLYNQEDYDRIEKTRKYEPCKGTTSEEYDKLCRAINKWLNDHYDMFELDYTDFDDCGSRDEAVLCYTKRTDKYDSPDFENELPKLVLYR